MPLRQQPLEPPLVRTIQKRNIHSVLGEIVIVTGLNNSIGDALNN